MNMKEYEKTVDLLDRLTNRINMEVDEDGFITHSKIIKIKNKLLGEIKNDN